MVDLVSSQKVKEGKIVKVEAQFDDVIMRLKISGDFFLHPEEVLDDIEKSMLGLKRDVSFDTLVFKIQNINEKYDARMIGISPESLALVIKEALKLNGEYLALKPVMPISIWLWMNQ